MKHAQREVQHHSGLALNGLRVGPVVGHTSASYRSGMGRLAKNLAIAVSIGGGWFVAGAFLLAVLGDEAYTEGFVKWWFGLSAASFAAALVALSKPWRDRRAAVLAGIVVPVVAVLAFVAVNSAGSEPVDLVAPRLSGTPRVGEVLTVSTGRWNPEGARHLRFLIKWESCNRNSCPTVIRTEQRTYRITHADVGRRIDAGVIAEGDLNAIAYTRDSAVVRP